MIDSYKDILKQKIEYLGGLKLFSPRKNSKIKEAARKETEENFELMARSWQANRSEKLLEDFKNGEFYQKNPLEGAE